MTGEEVLVAFIHEELEKFKLHGNGGAPSELIIDILSRLEEKNLENDILMSMHPIDFGNLVKELGPRAILGMYGAHHSLKFPLYRICSNGHVIADQKQARGSIKISILAPIEIGEAWL